MTNMKTTSKFLAVLFAAFLASCGIPTDQPSNNNTPVEAKTDINHCFKDLELSHEVSKLKEFIFVYRMKYSSEIAVTKELVYSSLEGKSLWLPEAKAQTKDTKLQAAIFNDEASILRVSEITNTEALDLELLRKNNLDSLLVYPIETRDNKKIAGVIIIAYNSKSFERNVSAEYILAIPKMAVRESLIYGCH